MLLAPRLAPAPRLHALAASLALLVPFASLARVAAQAAPPGSREAGSVAAGEAPDAAVADFAELVEAARAAADMPALSVAIVRGGTVLWAGGTGIADLEHGVPATEHTVYRLASISKPITAVTALRLAERGELDLDRPVQDYVEAFPRKRWPLTTRHLLGHVGGVRHYASAGEVRSARHYRDVVEPLAIFAADPLEHEPGTAYRYSTYGYNLAGAVVRAASGRPFFDAVRAEVLEPAGMRTLVRDDPTAIVPGRARGYVRRDGEIAGCDLVDTTNKVPGGGMCGSVLDLAAFAIAVLDGGLLAEETRRAMWTRQTLADGSRTGYGLGWGVAEDGGEVRHSGSQPGTSTFLLLRPARGTAVAAMTNLQRVRSLPALCRRLADAAEAAPAPAGAADGDGRR